MDLLRTSVKVGEINNLSDARFCAAINVQMLGFLLAHPERKALTKEEYIAISQWLEGPKFIGEFFGSNDEIILELNKELNFAYVQTDSLEQAKRLLSKGLEVIFITKESALTLPANLSYLVLDEGYKGNPMEYSGKAELLCGYGIDVDSLDTILADQNFVGIHLKGSDEIRPGYKNFDELADVLEKLSE